MSEENRPAKSDYCASVKTGLKRLESEKLSFLGNNNVISKFDPESVQAFSIQDDEDEPTLSFPTEQISEIEGNSGAISNTAISGLHTHQDDHMQTSQQQMIPDETQELSDIAKIVADEIDSTPGSSASLSASGKLHPTLEFASIKNYHSGSQRAISVDESSEYILETAEDDHSLTTDLSQSAAQIRQLSEDNPSTSSSIKARVLKSATVRSKTNSAENGSAMDRLKQQGLFDKIQAHAEVSDNIQDIKNIDSLIPPSKVESWDDDDDNEDLTVPFDRSKHQNFSLKDDDQALDSDDDDDNEDLTVPFDRSKHQNFSLKDDDQALDSDDDDDNEDLTVPFDRSKHQNFSLKDDDQPQNGDDDDDNEDLTVPFDRNKHENFSLQDSNQIQDKAHYKGIIQASSNIDPYDLDNLDLDNRETIPVNMKAVPADAFKKSILKNSILPTLVSEKTNKRTILLVSIIVTVILLIIVGAALIYSLHKAKQNRQVQITSTPAAIEESGDDNNLIRDAVVNASQAVFKTLGNDQWLNPWIDAKIHSESPEARIPILEMAINLRTDQADLIRAFTTACIESGQFSYARQKLKQFDSAETHDIIRELRDSTFLNDPKFAAPVLDMSEDDCDQIDPLGGGSTLTFKFKKNGEKIGAFKPLQTRKQSNYRSEIAAWRLCQLLECDFEIPWNRPVRISHALFNKLYARSGAKNKSSYQKGFADLTWTKIDGQTWLYGTLKDWVPDFTLFPIEMNQLWKPWLSQNHFMDSFRELPDALSPISRNQNVRKYLPLILEQAPSLETKQLASQISQVVTFDFLTENWDRFSTSPAYWGVNCQFKNNHIISIDNGASFPNYTNEKVAERFKMVERFSPVFIENLRNLDRERTLNMLFPDPSAYEIKGFDIFWKHRTEVLNTVDSLIEKFSQDSVLSL